MKLYRAKKFIGKVFPGGEFSCGFDVASYTAEKRRSKEYERIHALQYHALRDEEGEVLKRISLDEAEVYCPLEVEGQQARLDVGLSTLQNLRKTPKRYGLKGITSYGKRMLKAGAYLLEKRYGKKRLTFATFTLPPMPDDMRRVVHEHWGEVVNRTYEGLTYAIGTKSVESAHIVGCTEIQEKRAEAGKGVYLHLHCVFVGRGVHGAWWITPARARKLFKSSVISVLRRYGGECVDSERIDALYWNATERLEKIRKSVVGYLGKYISKGCKALASLSDRERLEACPKQWWNITRALSRWILASVIVLTEHEADALVNDEDVRSHACVWAKDVIITLSGFEYKAGAIGRLTSTAYNHLAKMHNAAYVPSSG